MWNLRGFVQRFSNFFGIGILTVLLGWLLLYVFTEFFGLSEEGLSYWLKLVLVITFNFFANDKVTWKGKKAAKLHLRILYFVLVKLVVALPNSAIYFLIFPFVSDIKNTAAEIVRYLPFFGEHLSVVILSFKNYIVADGIATLLIMLPSYALDDKYVFRKNGNEKK